MISDKRRLRRIWKHTRCPLDKTIYNKACKTLKQKISEYNNNSVSDYLNSISPHENSEYSLWAATKYLKQPRRRDVAIRSINNQWCRSDKEKANAFAEYLKAAFTPFSFNAPNDLQTVQQFLDSPCQLDFPPKTIRLQEVKTEIIKLNNKKCPGFDSISSTVVKLLPHKALVFLTYIFNAIIRLNHFPSQWKCAQIIMLLKPGKPENEVTSYRPISLLSTFSKIFERIFSRRMLDIISKDGIIPNYQFGFRKQHGTIEQCHRIVNCIMRALEDKKYCSAVFIDVQQAFDRVWHLGLLYKIKELLPSPYFLILKNYLSNRYFFIKHQNAESNLCKINSGVPQGSVLGPILYLLYTSDLPVCNDVTIATYADDTAILATSDTPQGASMITQNYLVNLSEWVNRWNIKVNTQKSVHVTFTMRRGNCPPVVLNNCEIPQESTVKYLGLHLDRRLTWSNHIKAKKQQLKIKAKKMYWLLHPKSQLSLENKLLLYKAILKPIWTYGIQLWGTTSNSNLEILERFQSRMLRQITGAPWFVTNIAIRSDLNIASVKEEAKRFSLSYQDRLEIHPNYLATTLLDDSDITKRLKRIHPLEIPNRC